MSLDRPGFWADNTTEPKRQHKWVLNINGIDQWIVKSVDKPSFTLSSAKHQYLNYEFKFPGRVKFNDISVSIVDPVNPDAAATLYTILGASGYRNPALEGPVDTPISISKAKATAAIGPVMIRQLDSDGQGYVEQWKLHNAWVASFTFGKLNYSQDSISDITLKLSYDWATLETLGLVDGAGQPSRAAVAGFENNWGSGTWALGKI